MKILVHFHILLLASVFLGKGTGMLGQSFFSSNSWMLWVILLRCPQASCSKDFSLIQGQRSIPFLAFDSLYLSCYFQVNGGIQIRNTGTYHTVFVALNSSLRISRWCLSTKWLKIIPTQPGFFLCSNLFQKCG